MQKIEGERLGGPSLSPKTKRVNRRIRLQKSGELDFSEEGGFQEVNEIGGGWPLEPNKERT